MKEIPSFLPFENRVTKSFKKLLYSMLSAVRRLMAIVSLSVFFITASAQFSFDRPFEEKAKPYKVLTSGKQITIKAKKDIKQVMLWTTSGNRVVEEKAVNANSYTMDITINQRNFFLMVKMADDKVYTEKIGIR